MRQMFIVSVCAYLLLSQAPVLAQTPAVGSFAVTYESPGLSISVQQGSVIQIKPVTDNSDPNAYAAFPETESRSLTTDELRRLKEFINSSQFMELSEAYGAPEGERCDRYAISVNVGGTYKRVTFRRNSAYDTNAPKAFTVLSNFIRNLVEKRDPGSSSGENSNQ